MDKKPKTAASGGPKNPKDPSPYKARASASKEAKSGAGIHKAFTKGKADGSKG
jgi:hypothetical protein